MSSPVPPENIALLTGPLLVGLIGNWWLYGILCLQYYLYLAYSGNDRLLLKITVHFIFLADTVQSILVTSDAFYWFAYNFGDVVKLHDFHLSSIDLVILDTVIAFAVQLVYCWRIWALSKWRVIPALIAFCSFVAFVGGMIMGILDSIAKTAVESATRFGNVERVVVLIWLFPSAISDVAIAGCMTYIVLRMNRTRGIEHTTRRRIMRILTLTLESNAITAAVAVEIIILFLITPIAPPATNIYLVGGFLLGKLYSNCFMVLLNQRQAREDGTNVVVLTSVQCTTSSALQSNATSV